MKALISPSEAQQRTSKNLPEVPDIPCPLSKCAGRILRETIKADRPLPPFDRSMMDGYAIRADEIDPTDAFTIVAQAPAGSAPVHPAETIGHVPGPGLPVLRRLGTGILYF